MKKFCLGLAVITALLILSSCKGHTPFDYPLTKWIGSDLEFYVSEEGNGYFVYQYSNEKTVVFDTEYLFGNTLFIYKHRDSVDQEVEIVAKYYLLGINNEKFFSFSLKEVTEDLYSEVFPQKLRLRRVDDLTSDDIKYEFFEVETDEWTEILRSN